MGSGASGYVKELESSSSEDVRKALDGLSTEDRSKISEALTLASSESAEPPMELGLVLDALFKCFDSDEDGQIEREEYLECCEKIATILDESFGPKQRKQKMAWYKEAGAEGSPEAGMYLSRKKWQAALVKTASEEASSEEEPKIAAWLWKSYGKRLAALCFPTAYPAEEAVESESPAERPQYPVTIPLTQLAAKLEEAKEWKLRPLILGNHVEEVHTFLKYQIDDSRTFDSSKLFLMKKEEKRALLKLGMDSGGKCYPLYLKLGEAAPDLVKSCSDDFPAEVFDASAWTAKAAFDEGFISQALLSKLDNDPDMWKLFTIIIHSDLGLDVGKAKLSDKLPYFEKLAIIVIDPASVAKG
eukprot:CAMPEP_0197625674 /NCGR_PEP_ID=MMETSP1338-20131121/4968_1 /TAXON_ID=43686 ORGANISM="Pelagodinium beii, Strain RCC1491" /NCGR_SAMPLE_ID=MMETSP1338 /ASSEMBLY_ACC=CAM_ASM_000754 /LENGTH=357 /DNA_ID=CAMNT_0043196131 /DNA_START=32 /DNA_END=1105 /DNA_ORIENTATION=-